METIINKDIMQNIRRAQKGDSHAFGLFFQQHKNLVFRTSYLILGNTHDAEDALQEIFVLVYKSLPNFDPKKGAITTWLNRIAVNYCLNLRRKKSPMQFPLDETILKNASTEMDIEENDPVWQSIRELSEKLRTVVILRYYREFSYSEIAQILEIPLGTVKSRLDLAIKTLRQTLDKSKFNSPPVSEIEVYDEL